MTSQLDQGRFKVVRCETTGTFKNEESMEEETGSDGVGGFFRRVGESVGRELLGR